MLDVSKFSSSAKFRKSSDCTSFLQVVPREFAFPVGRLLPGSDKIEVHYIPDGDRPVDAEWVKTRFPKTNKDFETIIKEAFEQYWKGFYDGWEMEESILECLQLEKKLPRDSASIFKEEGFTPFFDIWEFFLCPKHDAVVVTGGAEFDTNLAEHRVEIMFDAKGTTFEYGGEFYELYTDDP